MIDKKYTDKDIISSLQVIATTGNCDECKIRNCKWGTCNCSQITANSALDLINRQNSEIERLQKEANLVSIQFQDIQERQEESQAEIERLKKEIDSYDVFYFCSYSGCESASTDCWKTCPNSIYNKTRTEAYKEFAKKLKCGVPQETGVIRCSDVDNLVKEFEKKENTIYDN